MTERINDYSRDELAVLMREALLRRKPSERACLYCGTIQLMRPDQHFCCSKHRSAYHRDIEVAQQRMMALENERFREEYNRLVKENAALRERVLYLETLTKE